MKKNKKESLELITEKGTASQHALHILFDKSITNNHKTLEIYLTSKNITYHKPHLNHIKKIVEAEIYAAVEYISHLLYHIQSTTNTWGSAGEHQVKNGFLKCLLNLPADATITYDHYTTFDTTLAQNLDRLGITNIPIETAKNQLKNYTFKLLGRTFKFLDILPINRLLAFVASQKFYFVGTGGENLYYYLFGTVTQKHIKEYTIATYTHEDMRSPNVIGALAALTGNHIVVLRNESLATIFHQKWIPAIESKGFSYFQSNSFWSISQAIKEKTLTLYNIHTKDDLLKAQSLFLKDMRETIAFHELGHTIMNHKILTPEEYGLGQATEKIKETIYSSLGEFFADFAPKSDGFQGPIQNMINIAKKDRTRAERMFYMYLSDVWFYDTPDEYMYVYSDLMLLILIKYIQPDQHINFTNLEKDILIRKKRNPSDTITTLERLHELYIQETQEIKTIAKNASYTLISPINFDRVTQILTKVFTQNHPLIKPDTSTYAIMFWKSVMNFITQVSDSKDKLINYLDQQEKDTLKKILILSCGRKKAESYNYDHRKYITDRMVELGFTPHVNF